VSGKINSTISGVQVLVNKVPKIWVDYEIYCQLVPNADINEPNYQMIPRTGAFEVSFKGVVSLILNEFSIVGILKTALWTLA
jgi:hypothetical protein